MVNNKDIKILSHLRRDSRETLTNISKTTGIPTSTIFDRLKTQERTLIKRYTALLNFQKLGFKTRANIILRAGSESRGALENFLASHPSVNTLFKLSDEYDFLVEVIFRDGKDMDFFLQELRRAFPNTETEVFPIILEFKREAFLADPQLSERLLLP